MWKIMVCNFLMITSVYAAAGANEKLVKGKSGSTYERMVGPDGKPIALTLKGRVTRSLSGMTTDDASMPELNNLSKYAIQIESPTMPGLWVAHLTKSEWESYRKGGSVYVELSCTTAVKEKVSPSKGDFEIFHCAHGKQSSWWPF